MTDVKLAVKRLGPAGRLPTRGSADAAGYDLYSAEQTFVPAKGRTLVKTQIAVAIPREHYGRVAPRSGLAVKHGLDVGAGVIDSDYRGEVGVVLFNFGNDDVAVDVGDRIAQLILERISTPAVEEVADLPSTVRGADGFGSTGVNTESG